jgi:hypothetical protein
LSPIAPGFAPVRYGQPNPDAPGTFGPLGRPSDRANVRGNTRQLNALKADILKHYPGAAITSEYRSPDVQAGIAARSGRGPVWVAGPNGSHTWGTAADVVVSRKMWEQFKADMRKRGLRAYDEGTHVHVDDRTDLPDGPAEKRRRK